MTRIILARIAPSANVLPAPPPGNIGARYLWQFAITGRAKRYRYTLSGTLPDGLEWSPDAQQVSGVPTEAGRYPVTITIMGSDRIPIAFPFVIAIAPIPLSLVGALDPAPVGAAVTGSLTVYGGTPGYTLDGIDGTPPPGITFAMSSGVMTASGLTTLAGTFHWNFLIHDSAGTTARIGYTLKVGVVAVAYHIVTETGDHLVTESGDHLITNPIEE